MSHTVTVTRTTTTSTTSAILVNTGYLKTIPGLLKLAEIIVGAVCVGLISHYASVYVGSRTEFVYFLLVAVTFLVGTTVNFLSCLLSITTATILPKTLLELIYNTLAVIMYIAGAIALLVYLNKISKYSYNYEPLMVAGVFGLVNSALYLVSAVYSYRSYRGG